MASISLPFPKGLPEQLLGFSTKTYFSLSQTASYASQLQNPKHKSLLQNDSSTGVFFIPSFPALLLPEVQRLRSHGVVLGAQNCHWEDHGAFTGEVSPAMLKEAGCSIVELGHAERRRAPFGETDELIAKKAAAVVRNGMIPLVCIGEKNRGESISQGVGKAIDECQRQIEAVLEAIPGDSDVIFAYEPVWAIGASEPASAEHVAAVVAFLMKGKGIQQKPAEVRFLYGGSAGPGTWGELKQWTDGLFLGRFAHDIDALVKTLEEVVKT